MRNSLIIAKRELAAYFNSPVAYVVIGVFLLAVGGFFYGWNGGVFLTGRASLRLMFAVAPWLFMVFGPAMTMGLIAEERKSGTLEVLMTLPVTEAEVIVGKFMGAMGLACVMLFCTLPIPLAISTLPPAEFTFDWGPVVGGYVGTLLLASSFLAIGMFFSSLSPNQIVAFLFGVTFCLFLVLFVDLLVHLAPEGASGFFQHLSVNWHFQNIARGVVDSRDVIFYLAITYVALRATIWRLKTMRR